MLKYIIMKTNYKITARELKNKWIGFFENNLHKRIVGSSVVPENDPTVLFTTAGMQPLVPYLLGEKHPQGKRLTNSQACIRTGDIDEVGDNTHLTYFEMLGSWSIGDYFKEEAIKLSFNFLTSKEGLNLPLNKLAFTVFEGNKTSEKDEESVKLWMSHGASKDQIFYLPDNWWGLEGKGPCGTCTEMFYITKEPCGKNCNPSCDCGAYMEIWNDVFMAFYLENGKLSPLAQKNVDTGMGMERTLVTLNGLKSVYDIDLFANATQTLIDLGATTDSRERRIILDHLRAAVIIMGDRVKTSPSNSGRGYVLRRLIRRAILNAKKLNIAPIDLIKVTQDYLEVYNEEVGSNASFVLDEFTKEVKKFEKTIENGLKEFNKIVSNLKNNLQKVDADKSNQNQSQSNKETNQTKATNSIIDGKTCFRLLDTFGFPFEITKELAKEQNIEVDEVGFKAAFEEHRQKSQTANAGVFKGGLAGDGEMTTNLHTATHLLHAALIKVLGDTCHQRGSNINAERLRFDFAFDRKVTPEELKQIEEVVNEQIKKALPVTMKEMTINDAKKAGAIGVFDDKYGSVIKVYSVGDFSCEICGGPHAKNSKDLGTFKIVKEEASSSGVRRIKGILVK
jgi:alanyl-tRNA synthetase